MLVLVLVAGTCLVDIIEDTLYCAGTGTGCRYACLKSLQIPIVLVLVLILVAGNFALKNMLKMYTYCAGTGTGCR